MSNFVKRNICIVGGGPSGLSTLRRVLDSSKLTGTLFELKDDVGGLWNYNGNKSLKIERSNPLKVTELSNEDPEYVTTMYDGLRYAVLFSCLMEADIRARCLATWEAYQSVSSSTKFYYNSSANLPYVSLALEDFPNSKSKGTFPMQKEVHTYFRDYATHFNLWQNIELNTAVVNIRPESPSEPDRDQNGRWIVKTYNQKDDIFKTEIFDAVVICTGCNTFPFEPKLPGLELFQGKVMHSKYFKNAEEFQDKNLVLIGLGPSSADLGVHVSKTAKSVTICHKFPMGYKIGIELPNVQETKSVKEITSDGVLTVEDEYIKCDVIIFCTGYVMKFPFLDEECGLVVTENGKYVPHLYEMMIFTKRPTLAILNVVYRAPELQVTEIQAKYFVACLEGQIELPPYEQMELEINAEDALKKQQGIQYSEWYQVGTFGLDFWDYCLKLINKLGIRDQYKYYPLHVHLWKTAVMRVFGQYTLYRKDYIKIINDGEWEYYFSADPNDKDSTEKKMVMRIDPKNGKFTANIVEL